MIEPDHFRLDFVSTLHFYKFALQQAADISQERFLLTRRRLAENDLFFLLTNVLKRKDIMREWLFDRCREVQRSPDDHLDLWAREHYKSTIITFGLTIKDIINDPEITVGIFSFNKGIARDFLDQIKKELEMNTDLPLLWPHIFYDEPQKNSPRWSVDRGIVVKREGNPKEATVEGHGLTDGMPTGRHFKLRVYDDVVTMDGVNTPELIQKTTTAFQMSDNLGAEGGKARYIGTRYHLFDTYRTMMDDGIATPRIHPATHDGTIFGKAVLLTEDYLENKRKKQGTFVFSTQMLLNPIADASMGFKLEWVVKADTDYGAAMQSLWRFILVDPAGSKKRKNNDYTTMMVIGHGADLKYRVLEIRRDRMNLSARAKTLMELHRKWKPGAVGYEEYGMQADIEAIKMVQKTELYEFDITPLGGSMSKPLRILRLVPLFENGYVSVQDGGDGLPKSRIILPTAAVQIDYQGTSRNLVQDFLEQEFVAFPVLKHDDMLDCMARIVDFEAMGIIQTPSANPAPARSTRVEEGLRKLGQKGSESWVTV